MRDIKFRYWHIKHGLKKSFILTLEDIEEFTTLWANKYIDKEQYTGLKDKNGVEIYEGDILRKTDDMTKNSVVEWIEDNYCFNLGLNSHVLDQESGSFESGLVEVIGNIHENRELLENV